RARSFSRASLPSPARTLRVLAPSPATSSFEARASPSHLRTRTRGGEGRPRTSGCGRPKPPLPEERAQRASKEEEVLQESRLREREYPPRAERGAGRGEWQMWRI